MLSRLHLQPGLSELEVCSSASTLHNRNPGELQNSALLRPGRQSTNNIAAVGRLVSPKFFLLVAKFRVIAYLSDVYVAPAISKIAKHLKFSETVAGATLVAFANGVPDIMTSIISSISGEDPEGINELAIGSLMGANIFTYTCVFLGVVWMSPNREVTGLDKSNIHNDLLFILGSLTLFVVAGTLKVHLMGFGLLMFAVYGLYLYLLIRRDREMPRVPADDEGESLLGADNSMEMVALPGGNPVSNNDLVERWANRTSREWGTLSTVERILYVVEFPAKLVL